MNPVIAHISDLHFNGVHLNGIHHFGSIHNKNAAKALAQNILEDPKPHFIVATGDLSHRGKKKQLNAAKDFLENIVKELFETHGHIARYIVVPGNHDVGSFKSLKEWNKVFGTWGGGVSASGEPFDLIEYFQEKSNDREEARKLADEAARFCEFYPSFGIAFLKFNSNVLIGSITNYAKGKVGKPQLLKARQIIKYYEQACSRFAESRKIALVHHHMQYLPNTESDEFMLMKDAGDFWKAMLDMDMEMILHGHKHYSTHMGVKQYSESRDKEVMILSAGSTTSNDQPQGQLCSYYKIRTGPFKDVIQKYVFSDTDFTSNGTPSILFRHVPRIAIPDVKKSIDTEALEQMLVPEDDELDYRHYFRKITFEATIHAEPSKSKYDYIGKYTFEG